MVNSRKFTDVKVRFGDGKEFAVGHVEITTVRKGQAEIQFTPIRSVKIRITDWKLTLPNSLVIEKPAGPDLN